MTFCIKKKWPARKSDQVMPPQRLATSPITALRIEASGNTAMTALLAVNGPRPLDNFPLLRSAKIKEVRETFARIYAEPVLVVKPRAESLNAVINNCRLQSVELAFGAFGTEVILDFPTSGYVAQLFPLQGTAEITNGTKSIEVAAGSGCLLSSDAPHRLNFSADYAHLVLRVDARVLADKLRSMMGAPLHQPLRIDTQGNANGPAARMLQQYLPLLIETISQNDPPFPTDGSRRPSSFSSLFFFAAIGTTTVTSCSNWCRMWRRGKCDLQSDISKQTYNGRSPWTSWPRLPVHRHSACSALSKSIAAIRRSRFSRRLGGKAGASGNEEKSSVRAFHARAGV